MKMCIRDRYKLRVAVMLLCVALSGLFNAFLPYLSGSVLYDQVLGRDEALAASLGLSLIHIW